MNRFHSGVTQVIPELSHESRSRVYCTSLQSAKVESMQQLTGATAKLANALETKGRHDTWMKQATFYANIGNLAKAQEFMTLLEEDQQKIAAAQMAVEEEEKKRKERRAAITDREEEEEEHQGLLPPPSITIPTTAAVAGPKTTGEESEEEEEVSRTESGAKKIPGIDDVDDSTSIASSSELLQKMATKNKETV